MGEGGPFNSKEGALEWGLGQRGPLGTSAHGRMWPFLELPRSKILVTTGSHTGQTVPPGVLLKDVSSALNHHRSFWREVLPPAV